MNNTILILVLLFFTSNGFSQFDPEPFICNSESNIHSIAKRSSYITHPNVIEAVEYLTDGKVSKRRFYKEGELQRLTMYNYQDHMLSNMETKFPLVNRDSVDSKYSQKFKHITEYKYDSLNRKSIVKRTSYYNDDTKVISIEKHSYYNNTSTVHDVSEEDIMKNNVGRLLDSSVFNKAGQIIEYYGFSNGKVWDKRVYQHKNNGSIVIEYFSTLQENTIDSLFFENGCITSWRAYALSGELNIREDFIYEDKSGLLVKIIGYFENGISREVERVFNEKGHLISETETNFFEEDNGLFSSEKEVINYLIEYR